MSKVVADWKHFQTRKYRIIWQGGYFDHRLRDDERGEQLSAKMNYIRHNPVAARSMHKSWRLAVDYWALCVRWIEQSSPRRPRC